MSGLILQKQNDTARIARLRQWFSSPAGQQLLAQEAALLAEPLQDCFGYSELRLGLLPESLPQAESRVQSSITLGWSDMPRQGRGLDICCTPTDLPIASESQDLVLLHHLLEFIDRPHQLLREIERVLVPRGRIMILGFNPWSLWGLRNTISNLRSNSAWHSQLLALRRLGDWLQLLGFDIEAPRYTAHRLPMNTPNWFPSALLDSYLPEALAERLPFGSVYLLSAVKQRASITPAMPKWQRPRFANVSPIGAARAKAAQRVTVPIKIED